MTSILITLAFLFSGPALADNIDATLPDSDNTSSFQVKNSESSNNILMKIQSGGNVGIGTTDPKEKFQIGDRFTFNGQVDGSDSWRVISDNSYYNDDTGADTRIVNGYASAMAFTKTGDILFRTADTGSAGDILDGGSYPTWNTPPLFVKNDGNVGIGTDSPNSTLHVNGSFSMKYAPVTSNHTVSGETIIGVKPTSSDVSIAISIPATEHQPGRVITIKNETGFSGSTLILITPASGTIDGGSSYSITGGYGFVQLYSNGSNWFVIAESDGA